MPDGIKLLPQRQTAKVLDDGNVHDVVEVQFTVDNDGPFTETIRVSDYSPEIVRARVTQTAERVRAARAAFE